MSYKCISFHLRLRFGQMKGAVSENCPSNTCVCVNICIYIYVCKVECSACIYSIILGGDAQGYSAYVLHGIDSLEKTNVMAVDKPQQHLTK